mgnify:FL=1
MSHTKEDVVPTWHCDECNSMKVFEESYVNPNTGDSFLAGSGKGWCQDCQETRGDGACHLSKKGT